MNIMHILLIVMIVCSFLLFIIDKFRELKQRKKKIFSLNSDIIDNEIFSEVIFNFFSEKK